MILISQFASAAKLMLERSAGSLRRCLVVVGRIFKSSHASLRFLLAFWQCAAIIPKRERG
jgi:hypothetical protein